MINNVLILQNILSRLSVCEQRQLMNFLREKPEYLDEIAKNFMSKSRAHSAKNKSDFDAILSREKELVLSADN